MHFGITIKPDMPVERIVRLTRQAEDAGFEYGWVFDSHILWLEPYPLLTLMASNTKKMRLGTCVTNPATRDITVTSSLFATLNLISKGRMQLGIGRGDSSRRVLGKKPVGAGDLERAVKTFRDLTSAREIEYDGQPTRISWAKGSPPVWIAGYGPKVLDLAGRVGDGVILQFADPDLIAWCLGFVKKGAEAAGRDFRKIEVMAAAPVWVSDNLKVARERVRWFPALVSNHVVDLISRYKPEELPAALTSFVRNRGAYDYQQHCEVESSNSKFVSDEVVDRFCLVGPAKAHQEKLRKLASVGVTQFNMYLMCGDEEDTLETYRKGSAAGFSVGRKGLDPIIKGAIPVLPAADTEESLKWWTEICGFNESFRDSTPPNYAGIQRGDAYLHISGMSDKALARKVGDQTMVRLVVKGIEAMYAEYQKRGGTVHPNGPLQTKPWGTKEFSAIDPNGVCVTFQE